jgi:hypothetical protein
MSAPIAGDPIASHTVTIADQHSNSVQWSGVPGRSNLDAALSVAQIAAQATGSLTATDHWTITITQP